MLQLSPVHPLRLGVALNFAVYCCDVLGDHGRACGVARRALHDGIANLDTTSTEEYTDLQPLLQLLQDNNLTLLTADAVVPSTTL
jgi:14-3-3 protein epsilon